ncbi:MAG: aminotransferase class V-fold PLP-dependent enzyme, partial [Desulfatiglandales bacterium]
MNRIHNFNPGPAALPLEVLQTIKEEMLDFKGTGMSILEISHRSKQFEEVLNTAIERLKRLLGIKEGFHVVFVQGGATLQFAMVPLNLSLPQRTVSYIDTGTWSTKAIKEAKILGKDVVVVASSQDREYTYIPKDFTVDSST